MTPLLPAFDTSCAPPTCFCSHDCRLDISSRCVATAAASLRTHSPDGNSPRIPARVPGPRHERSWMDTLTDVCTPRSAGRNAPMSSGTAIAMVATSASHAASPHG